MWNIVTNPIVSHLLCAGAGAAGAWYATHRTAVASAEASVKQFFNNLEAVFQFKSAMNQGPKAVPSPTEPPKAA